MIRNKDYRDLIHASFSNIAFNAISSAISAGHLTGPHVLIGGNWHLGPLKERKLSTLSTWFSDHFGYIPPDLIVNTPTPSTNGSIKICAWVNPLSSIEYSNFIHWVSHHNPDNFLLTLAPKKPPILSRIISSIPSSFSTTQLIKNRATSIPTSPNGMSCLRKTPISE